MIYAYLLAGSLPGLMGQCCSGGVPISGNLSLAGKESGTLQFQLTYDYNTLRDLFSGRENLRDKTRERNTHSLLLETQYDFNRFFSINTLLSLVRQEQIIATIPGQSDFTRNTGIGDGILLLKYNLLPHALGRQTQISLGAGPKFPLGRSNIAGNDGILLPADLQPGTGAWDAMFWGYLSRSNLIRPTTTLSLIPTFRLSGIGKRNNDLQEYRFGNELQAQIGISDRFLLGGIFVDPMLTVQFRTVAQDRVRDVISPVFDDFPNTGGTYVYLLPGFSFSTDPRWTLRLSGAVPLYRELTGTQVTTSYRLFATLYYSLPVSGASKNPF